MLETFESRVERLGGAITLLPVRSVVSAKVLWVNAPGWQGVAVSATGDGVLVAVSPEHQRAGFVPNCTAVLWDVAGAAASTGRDLLDGTVANIDAPGVVVEESASGPLPVDSPAFSRWFRDEVRLEESGVRLDMYARLDITPCVVRGSGWFHALQRTSALPRDSGIDALTPRLFEADELCTIVCEWLGAAHAPTATQVTTSDRTP